MSSPDVSLERRILASIWSMVAVSGVFVALKIVARSRRRMRWWWDDYMMLLSWLCLGGASIVLTDATAQGLGRHVEFLDSHQRSEVLRLGHISAVLTITASTWTKVSFGLFLLRISSSGCTEWIRRAILGIIVSLNVMLVTAVTLILTSCRPTRKIWRPEVEGTCLDDRVRVFGIMGLAVYSGVADLVLALLPWKIIWCLPVRKRDKLGLVAVMSLGVLAAVASFIKCAYIHLMVSEDFSFDGWTLVLWAILEPTVTVVATTIPVIRTFIRDLAHSFSNRRASLRVDSELQQKASATGSVSSGGKEPARAELARNRGREGSPWKELSVHVGMYHEESEVEGQRHESGRTT